MQHGSKNYARRPPPPPPPRRPWGQKVKIQLFQNMVILHIKLKAITNAVTWSKYFDRSPPPPSP